MAQINSGKLMKELNAKDKFWSAGQTYESIVWKDKPVFTKEQFEIKYNELIQSDSKPEPKE